MLEALPWVLASGGESPAGRGRAVGRDGLRSASECVLPRAELGRPGGPLPGFQGHGTVFHVRTSDSHAWLTREPCLRGGCPGWDRIGPGCRPWLRAGTEVRALACRWSLPSWRVEPTAPGVWGLDAVTAGQPWQSPCAVSAHHACASPSRHPESTLRPHCIHVHPFPVSFEKSV